MARGPLARVVLVLLLLAGAATLPRTLFQGAWKLASGIKHLRESPLEARRRVFGTAYADAVESIRRAIPSGGEYLLAERSREPGQPNWIRYDLAPRRALYVGRLSGTTLVVPKEGLPRSRPAFVVVAVESEQAPELVPAGRFFEATRAFDPVRRDDTIPASIDGPQSGSEVTGVLAVQGWCQELGERPCTEIRFLIDDMERTPDFLERRPRPDVQAAIPAMGPCDRAGYHARFS
ncbi:MAG: hypothetical protein ABIT01_16860, partial [Thermoanaerobaculia bacterium]